MARVAPSPTGALLGRVRQLQDSGIAVINLGTGEPDFETPEFIRKAAQQAIDAGATRYTPIDGTVALREAVVDKFQRENGLDYPLDSVLISCGAKQAIFNACLALLDEGTEAVVPAPYWVSYPDIVRLGGGEAVIVPTSLESGFKITPKQLDSALSERTRAVILNSPSNPTGASYSKAEFEALGAVLERYPDVAIISDEIYEHIHWAEHSFTSFAAACPALFDRTLTVNGVSKAYAMTGWRIGYVAGPHELIGAIKTLQSQSTSNPAAPSQAAAVAALRGDASVVQEMTERYRKRHDFLVPALNAIDGIECRPSDGTFYAFPRVTGALERRGLETDVELVSFLIDEARVAMMPGTPFGAPGHLRLSYASSMSDLEEAVERLSRALGA